jgi:hypothetical protein
MQIVLYHYPSEATLDWEIVHGEEGQDPRDLWDLVDITKHCAAVVASDDNQIVMVYSSDRVLPEDQNIIPVIGDYLEWPEAI